MSTDGEPKDPIIEKIKVLYSLGEGGQYEIIQRTIPVIEALLILGKSSKYAVDNMMDKGVKPLELGIALAVALDRTGDEVLSPSDRELRAKILATSQDMLQDFYKLEAMNEGA